MEDPEISLVVFPVEDIHVERNRLRAYVPSRRGWRRAILPIPKIIHKRVIHSSPTALRTLQRLRRRGTIIVNPCGIRNKVRINALLSRDPALKDHIPITLPYRPALLHSLLARRMNLILKPQLGSAGLGVIRIDPLPRGRARVVGKSVRIVPRRALRRYLRRNLSLRGYLIQQCVDLARYKGRPFDLRVPVQRNVTGEWSVPGMVAKVARRHRFLTNIAQGGRAIPGIQMLEYVFSTEEAQQIAEQIETLALDIARAIARRYPYAADLGLDIGVDVNGKPWLIEMNTRDQRITFAAAGLATAFRELYRNPLAYCTQLQRARFDAQLS